RHGPGPFLLADLAGPSDLVALGLGHLGPEPRLRIQRVALHELLGALDDLLEEGLVYVLRDEEARAGGADLALVVEDRAHRAATGGLEVGVVEHDVGRLSAQLEGDLLQRLRSVLHDELAGGGLAGKGDPRDTGMRDEGGARGGAEPGNDVQDPGRKTGFER